MNNKNNYFEWNGVRIPSEGTVRIQFKEEERAGKRVFAVSSYYDNYNAREFAYSSAHIVGETLVLSFGEAFTKHISDCDMVDIPFTCMMSLTKEHLKGCSLVPNN